MLVFFFFVNWGTLIGPLPGSKLDFSPFELIFDNWFFMSLIKSYYSYSKILRYYFITMPAGCCPFFILKLSPVRMEVLPELEAGL